MEIESVAIESIQVGARMRNLDDERVEALAGSIKALGLQTPISVWASEDGSEVRLVAGHHRLAAVRKLGWEDIDCALVNMTEIDRKRWEISENLHRSELTALERDQHISEWERLGLEAEAEKVRKDSALKEPGKGRGSKGGTREVARQLGVDEKAVRNARKVSTLTDEAKEVAREVGLDNNRSALLKAAARPAEEQVETLRQLAQRKDPEPDPQWTMDDEKTYAALVDAWEAATPTARRQFIREYGRKAA